MDLKIKLCVIFLIFRGFAFAGTIEKTYHAGNYRITKSGEYQTIVFENSFLSGLAGQPALPYFNISIILPPGHIADSIWFTGHELTKIEGSFLLYPQQYPQPVSLGETGNFTINRNLYSSSERHPKSQLGNLKTEYMNGFSLAMSTFTPLVYIPSTGEVFYYKSVTVALHTKPAISAEESLKNLDFSTGVLKRIKLIAQDSEMISLYPKPQNKSDQYDMLIITSQQFENSFQQLIDHYKFRGIKAQVVSTATIYSNSTGADNPEKIRNYLISEYQTHGIQYVNLAGDAEIVPYRGFYARVQSSSVYEDSNIPSDLYYSALDGNWNTDGDNLWAEIGEDDLLPEISVGRMTFSNQGELDILIHKAIFYQANPVPGEFRKPLMAGEFLYNNPLTYGCDYLDLLEGVRNDNGYTTTGYPEDYNIQWMCDENVTWTKAQLIAKINEGSQFINHVGHANQNYTMRFNLSDVTNSNFSQVNGITRNYSLIYTHGCICGAFDYSDCIAEKFLNIENFAVAGAFNSRYGWFNEGTTEGPSAHLHREFMDALFDSKESHIGTAHLISKIQTSPWVNAPGQWEEGALRWCFYDCNILGDPALRIWADEPMEISVEYENEITTETTSISILVRSNSFSVSGLVCIMVKNDTVISRSETNTEGIAELTFDPLTSGNAQIYISGYNCQLHSFPLLVKQVYKISGVVQYCNSETSPVGNVNIALSDENFTNVANTISASNGSYQFSNLTPGNYHLTFSCNIPWQGCNATDALLISLHSVTYPGYILTGLQLKAADVNNSNSITSFDTLMVLQRTVGLIDQFNISDWLIEDYEFLITNQNLIYNPSAICSGDVNCSDNQP